MTRTSRWILAALVGTALTVQVQAQEPAPVPAEEAVEAADEAMDAATSADLVATLEADGRFTVLIGALQSTNLVTTLQGEGPYTLFAPTDEAFASLPEGALDVLTPEQLQTVLLYHVVGGAVDGATASAADEAASAMGQMIQFNVTEDGLRVNEALVVEADLAASNGVIHVIDGVLMPPADEAEGTPDDSPGDGSGAESGPDDGP